MNPGKDYPAQHSMDTMWYCTDECGHIAGCWSSESGAIPESATTEIEDYSPSEDEAPRWYSSNIYALETCDPKHIEWMLSEFRYRHQQFDRWFGGGVAFMEKPGPKMLAEIMELMQETKPERPECAGVIHMIGKDMEQPDLFEKPKGNPELVAVMLFDRKHQFIYDFMHAKKLCVACTRHYTFRTTLVAKDQPIFCFDHPSHNGAPWPYMLSFVPTKEKLVTIGMLKKIQPMDPKVLRKLTETRIKGCFAKKKFWQPADDFECEFYDDVKESPPVSLQSADFKTMKQDQWGYW